MKTMLRTLCLALSILTLLLMPACGGQEGAAAPSEETSSTSSTTVEEKIDTVEALANLDEVVSLEKVPFSSPIEDALAYKMRFRANDLTVAAEIVLPADYRDTAKPYPVLLYFPEVGMFVDDLAVNYAANGVIVVRLYARGFGDSEGTRDMGGPDDLRDAKMLLSICERADFLKNSKFFVAGSSEGSITAMRLLAEDDAHRLSGCAVTDAVTDLHSFALSRGAAVAHLIAGLVGGSYEEAPEEYALRSAVTFPEKLDRPLLLLRYTQNPLFPATQAEGLRDLLQDREDFTYENINALESDFAGKGLAKLLSWIDKCA